MTNPHDALRDDPVMGPLIDQYGERTLTPADDLFERMVVSVINQLISTEAARTIRERVFDRFTTTPAGMLAADDDALRDAGLSPQKLRAIRNIAEWFLANEVSHEYFDGRSDDDIHAELTTITGVGDWTAKMVLMHGLGRPDIFPVEDLAIRRGMQQLFDTPEMSRAEMYELAEQWRPHRSTAALYVWAAYVRANSSVDDPVVE